MNFEDLLAKLWMYDGEVFAHDSLFVFKNYITREEKVFHNCNGNEIQEWIDDVDPILCAFNCNNYDKHILRCWIAGMSPEELKGVNDFIIRDGGNGWDIDVGYIKVPIMWDLFNEINPRKSLKEIEGNLRLNITETSVPFDIPTKLTPEQYQEVLYYCRCDVDALFPLFDKLKNKYKSKYIISKIGNIEPAFGLSQTDANLTAILLQAEKRVYTDNFDYKYPPCVDKSKIPADVLNYFDDVIAHNDLNYNPPAPEIRIQNCIAQLGYGGIHMMTDGVFSYDRGDDLLCE